MYRDLSGSPVFQTESAFDAMYKQVHETPVPLRTLCPWLPLELEQIVNKALAKSRDARFQSMAEFKLALEKLRDGLAGNALSDAGDTKELDVSRDENRQELAAGARQDATVGDRQDVMVAAVPDGSAGSTPNQPNEVTRGTNVPLDVTSIDVQVSASQEKSPSKPSAVSALKKEDTIHLVIPKPSAKKMSIAVIALVVVAGVLAFSFHTGQVQAPVNAPPPAPPLPAGINGLTPNASPPVPGTDAIHSTEMMPVSPPLPVKPLPTAPNRTAIQSTEQSKHVHTEKHVVIHEKKPGFMGKLKKIIRDLDR